MISHEEAQELHRIIGQYIEGSSEYAVATMVSVKDLERARELAALLVADTMEGVGTPTPDTSIDIYLTGSKDGPDMFGVIYDDEDGVKETAEENEECAWRVPVQPDLGKAELIYEYKEEESDD